MALFRTEFGSLTLWLYGSFTSFQRLAMRLITFLAVHRGSQRRLGLFPFYTRACHRACPCGRRQCSAYHTSRLYRDLILCYNSRIDPSQVVEEISQIPCVINCNYNGRPGYNTNDILAPHPTKPGYWRVYGRADDQIMHSTGEKVRLDLLSRTSCFCSSRIICRPTQDL